MIKKYANGFIVVGFLMLCMTFILMMAPSYFTDKNPYTTNTLDSYTDDSGAFVFRTAPFSPDEDYPLGTDDSGRDIWSFIAYGTKLTLSVAFSVTLLRFLLALVVGIGAGYDKPLSTMLIQQFNHVFNAIPPVLMCILVLNIPYFKTFSKSASTVAFICVLTLVEWGRSGEIVKERVKVLRQKDFIKSEIAIGKHPLQIIVGNIIPHLLPELTVMFFMEIARVLTMLMQLGIFNVYIGNLRIVASSDQGMVIGKATSYEPEWSSMLGSAKNAIRTAPWIVFASAGAFFFVVLGFNMLGEGIRRQLHKLNIMQFSKRNAAFGGIMMVGIVMVILMPLWFVSTTYRGFNLWDASNASFDQPFAMPGSDAQRSYVVERLKALEVLPVEEGEDYEIPYEPIDFAWLSGVSGSVGNTMMTDLVPYTYQPFDGYGYVYDARYADLMDLSNTERAKMQNKFVLINPDLYASGAWYYFAQTLLDETNAKGVIVLVGEGEPYDKLGTEIERGVIMGIPKRYEKALLKDKLHISVQSQTESAMLTNVVGKIEGHPDPNAPEAIILGFDLNYELQSEGEARFTFIFNLIKALKDNESRLTKSIIIVFWDGGHLGVNGGRGYYNERYLYPIKNTAFYMDLTRLNMETQGSGKLTLDTHLISDVKPASANFTNLLLENIEAVSTHPDAFAAMEMKDPMFYKWGIPTLYVNFDTAGDTELSQNTFGNLLVESLVFELY